jgi:ornithine cyclodeaminase/alanine dehydrogenase-like protein (mu-crystallin family)
MKSSITRRLCGLTDLRHDMKHNGAQWHGFVALAQSSTPLPLSLRPTQPLTARLTLASAALATSRLAPHWQGTARS